MPSDDTYYLAERYATKIGRMTALIEKIALAKNPVAEELIEAWMDFLLVHVEQIDMMQKYIVTTNEILQTSTKPGIQGVQDGMDSIGTSDPK